MEQGVSPKVDDWIDWIRDVTFETRLVPLSREEVEALLSGDEQTLAAVLRRIKDAMEGWDGVFVRLSHLSPKDATMGDSEALVETLRELAGGRDLSGEYSTQVVLLNRALYERSRMGSAEEALALIRASSRVRGHLERGLETPGFSTGIVLRRWYQIQPELEFRGFVFAGRLVAISHYYKFLFVPQIVAEKRRLAERMESFFTEHVQGRVPLPNYVVDFAVCPERCYAIELNPWALNTSSGLFEWSELVALAQDPNTPLCFRVLEEPLPNVLHEVVSLRLRMVLQLAFAGAATQDNSSFTVTKKHRRQLKLPLGSARVAPSTLEALESSLRQRNLVVVADDLRFFSPNVRQLQGDDTAHVWRLLLLLTCGMNLSDDLVEDLVDAVIAFRNGDMNQVQEDIHNCKRLAKEFALS